MTNMKFQGYPDASVVTPGPVEGTNYILEKNPVQVRCTNCRRDNYTRVENKISGNGMAWAIICCCFGSWLLSLLVLCVDGFREFLHFCPSCNSMVGTYKPKFSGGFICVLILLTIGVVALQILIIMFYVIPMIENGGRGY